MKNNNRCSWLLYFAVVFTLCTATSVNAALVDRGGGLIYDTDLNITWLANANYARQSGYDADGLMTWSQATTWATNLSYYDNVRAVTYDDWRLPINGQTCNAQSSQLESRGYNCTNSEMGHLFYNELGGAAGISITSAHNANYNLFSYVQSARYWSGSEPAPNAANTFNFHDGYQDYYVKIYEFYAWAVRPGDVAAVPIPAAFWLFGSGLIGLFGFARKNKASKETYETDTSPGPRHETSRYVYLWPLIDASV